MKRKFDPQRSNGGRGQSVGTVSLQTHGSLSRGQTSLEVSGIHLSNLWHAQQVFRDVLGSGSFLVSLLFGQVLIRCGILSELHSIQIFVGQLCFLHLS